MGETSKSLSGKRLALTTIVMAQLVLQLDFSIVNVALPQMQRQLGFSNASLQWIVTGYALLFGSLLLLGGKAGDVWGRRRVLLAGLSLFGISSLTSGLAQAPWILVVSRFLQGGSGAFIAPTALSLLTTTFSEGTARQRALGMWQAASAAGASLGVVIGGVLTELTSWRAIFFVNVPIVLALILLMRRVLPADSHSRQERIDYAGAGLVAGAIASLIFGLTNGQQTSFGNVTTLVALALASLLAIAFLLLESHLLAPMVPFGLVIDRGRGPSYLAMFMMGGATVSCVYFVSLYLQQILKFTPLTTGLISVPSTLTVMFAAMFLTRTMLKRVKPGTLLFLGMFVMALGQFWLSRVGTGHGLATILLGLEVMSLGMGLAFPSAAIGATTGVGNNQQGVASGLLTTSQQVGAAVVLAILATLAASRTNITGSLTAGYRLGFLVAATMVAVCGFAIIAMRLVQTQETSSGIAK